jgi:hypothetical protein
MRSAAGPIRSPSGHGRIALNVEVVAVVIEAQWRKTVGQLDDLDINV